MKKLLICCFLLLLAGNCLAQLAVQSENKLITQLMENPDSELLVMWKNSTSDAQRQRIIRDIGGQTVFSFSIIKADTLLFASHEERIAAEYKLNNNSAVRFTENNDPRKKTAQPARKQKQTGKARKKKVLANNSTVYEDWRKHTRMDEAPGNYKQVREVIVAIIGPGVDLTHPKINDSAWTNEREKNGAPGIDDDHNGWIDDIHGINPIGNIKNAYGDTNEIASTILALGNYSKTGINDPDGLVKIMPITGYKGFYNSCWDWSIWTNRSILLNCIEYATSMGADMIVMPGYIADSRAVLEAVTSFPGLVFTGSVQDTEDMCEIYDPLLMFSGQKNIVAVSSPGSSYWGVVGKPGDLAANGFVTISFPGKYIWTTSYTLSAAHAAGTAARLKSVFTHLTDDDIKNLLISTGDVHLRGGPTRNKVKLNSAKVMLGRSTGGILYANDWAKIHDDTPFYISDKYVHAWDEKRNLLYVYGGYYEGEKRNEFWVWNGIKWREIEKNIFQNYSAKYMFYHEKSDRLAILEGNLEKIWFWDSKKWEFKELPETPLSSYMEGWEKCVYDPNLDVIFYTGNDDEHDWGKNSRKQRIYVFDWHSWKKLKMLKIGSEVIDLFYDSQRNKMIFLESNYHKNVVSNIWEYDGQTMKRSRIPTYSGYPLLTYFNKKENTYYSLQRKIKQNYTWEKYISPMKFSSNKWQTFYFEWPENINIVRPYSNDLPEISWCETKQKLFLFDYGALWQYSGSINPIWIDNLPLPQSDYDGDGKADFALWRPSTGEFIINNKYSKSIGKFGGIPVPGDYNGDGRVEFVTFQLTSGKNKWIFDDKTIFFSKGDQIPVPGDYNGDGKTEIVVYDRNKSQWIFRADKKIITQGLPGDIPVPADYDGDGSTDLATYTPLTSTWHIQGMEDRKFGKPGDSPVPADYDGDGRADLATWDYAKTTWLISTPGSNNNSTTIKFGTKWAIPVPGDYYGNGKSQLATFSPITGIWHIQGREPVNAGKAGDVPLVRGK